jgi:hypothetical protein
MANRCYWSRLKTCDLHCVLLLQNRAARLESAVLDNSRHDLSGKLNIQEQPWGDKLDTDRKRVDHGGSSIT